MLKKYQNVNSHLRETADRDRQMVRKDYYKVSTGFRGVQIGGEVLIIIEPIVTAVKKR